MSVSHISIELQYNSGNAESGTIVTDSILGLFIKQSIDCYHNFEIKLNADVIEGKDDPLMQQSKQNIGKKIKIQLNDTVFIGVVNQISVSKTSGGFKGDLVIKGFSPDFMMDDMPNTQSFANTSLKEIIKQVKSVYPGNLISFNDDKIAPQYTTKLDYLTQFNESGYQFIRRLAADFGEWYYYDGTETYFGLPEDAEGIKLYSGSDLLSFSISLEVRHSSYKMQFYDYLKNETVNKSIDEAPRPEMDSLSDYAFDTSKSLTGFKPQYVSTEVYNLDTPLAQVANDIITIDSGVTASQFVTLSGVSNNSALKLGSVIEVREKSGADKSGEENLGDYRIVSITHQSTGQGNYQNTFTAIPKALKFPPANKIVKPVCPSQPAIVTDNQDSLGRVRVQFYWQKEKNLKTPWIRVLSTHAGNGRGFYFLPEVGDEVLVSFADNDPDQPYVAGSLFHGKAKPATNGRSIITAGGNCIVFNDEKDKQQINIFNNKNKLLMSCEEDGKMTFYSDGDIDLKSKKRIRCFAKDAFEAVAGSIVLTPVDNLDIDNPPTEADYYAQMTPDRLNFNLKGDFLVHGDDDLKIEFKGDTISAIAGSDLHLESDQKADIKATGQLAIDGGTMASLKGAMVKIN